MIVGLPDDSFPNGPEELAAHANIVNGVIPTPFRWLRDTTQSYRMGFVEGEDGERDKYMLRTAAPDIDEYERGYADGAAKRELPDWGDTSDPMWPGEVSST